MRHPTSDAVNELQGFIGSEALCTQQLLQSGKEKVTVGKKNIHTPFGKETKGFML